MRDKPKKLTSADHVHKRLHGDQTTIMLCSRGSKALTLKQRKNLQAHALFEEYRFSIFLTHMQLASLGGKSRGWARQVYASLGKSRQVGGKCDGKSWSSYVGSNGYFLY